MLTCTACKFAIVCVMHAGDGADTAAQVMHSHRQLYTTLSSAHDTGDGADPAAQSHSYTPPTAHARVFFS